MSKIYILARLKSFKNAFKINMLKLFFRFCETMSWFESVAVGTRSRIISTNMTPVDAIVTVLKNT